MKAKHMLLMVACCAIPLVALGAVTLLGIPLTSVLTGAMILICPLGHLLMMKFMMGSHGDHAGHEGHAVQDHPSPVRSLPASLRDQ